MIFLVYGDRDPVSPHQAVSCISVVCTHLAVVDEVGVVYECVSDQPVPTGKQEMWLSQSWHVK